MATGNIPMTHCDQKLLENSNKVSFEIRHKQEEMSSLCALSIFVCLLPSKDCIARTKISLLANRMCYQQTCGCLVNNTELCFLYELKVASMRLLPTTCNQVMELQDGKKS